MAESTTPPTGGRCYRVGGAVRDRLLGYPSSENDWVVVGSSPEKMIAAGFTPVGQDFPVFLHPQTKEEYALARTERKSGKGYGGFTFHTDKDVSLEQDLSRRDLTINAMAEDTDGQIIDPYGGRADLDARWLRHVSDRFREDPLRVLRIARFAARYHHLGFRIAPETLALLITMTTDGELKALAHERIWRETSRALEERNPEVYFETLYDIGALKTLALPLHHHWQDREQQRISVARLQSACAVTPSAISRCAALCLDLSADATTWNTLRCGLGIPKRPLKWLHAACIYRGLTQPRAINATLLHDALIGLDALKHEEGLVICSSAWEAECQRDNQSAPMHAWLCAAATEMQQVDANAIVKQGFSGKEIGKELQRQRIERLEEWLQNHPLR